MSYREAFIRRNFGYLKSAEMAQRLGITMNQLYYLRRRLNLRRKSSKEFSEEEGRTIIDMYSRGHTQTEIAKHLRADRRRVGDYITSNLDKFPAELRYQKRTIRGKVLCSAKDYAAQFGDPHEAFLMVLKRRQEVCELMLTAASLGTQETHSESNEVARLLPYWQDLNAHAHRLAKML